MTELIYTIIVTHITIVCVTLFLHRSQTHKGVTFHPAVEHFMRFWIWLTTGMVTKIWVAVHRKHHQTTDVEGDPHSPHIYGIKEILFAGAGFYNRKGKDAAFVMKYGMGTPKDWVERKIYTPHHSVGIYIMLAIDLLLFGWVGLVIWGIQMIWIPFWAAGVINGIGHWWGYRNGETKDHSKNIIPIGILIGGEEMHNNHHLDPGNPKFSRRWFEFDVSWLYIRILCALRLAKLR